MCEEKDSSPWSYATKGLIKWYSYIMKLGYYLLLGVIMLCAAITYGKS